MANFWKLVNKVIGYSDILLIVLDVRNWEQSRNMEIEKKILSSGKKFLYVLNKCDLLSKKEFINLDDFVLMSSTKHIGNMRLLRRLSFLSKGKNVVVGVLGYPNVGKSSVINALKGKASARVSCVSGFTTGLQKVRVTKNILLIDTPGVLPFNEKDISKQVLIGAKNVDKLKDVDCAAMDLIVALNGRVEKHFKVGSCDNPEEVLEEIAKKMRFLKSGGVADLDRAAKLVIRSWQNGKMV